MGNICRMIAYPRKVEEPKAEQNTTAPCCALENRSSRLTNQAMAIQASSSPSMTAEGASWSRRMAVPARLTKIMAGRQRSVTMRASVRECASVNTPLARRYIADA